MPPTPVVGILCRRMRKIPLILAVVQESIMGLNQGF